jgi:hypothetical protein
MGVSEVDDAVLTPEGRALLEHKSEKLRTEILPALLRAFCEDSRDELTRTTYEDSVTELRRIESLLTPAGPVRPWRR